MEGKFQLEISEKEISFPKIFRTLEFLARNSNSSDHFLKTLVGKVSSQISNKKLS